MKIVKFPHESLFNKTKPVTVFDAEIKVLLDVMWQTMIENNGIGLAANQVNIDYSMFVMLGPGNPNFPDVTEKIYLINPKITKMSMVTTLIKEGCLSAPGELIVNGSRREWVEVEYQDHKGVLKKRVFKGIHSVCVQHEIEHLEGKSYMEAKTIPKAKRKELAKKWGIQLK